MRAPIRIILTTIVAAGACALAVACNLIVESQFKDKTSSTDGSAPQKCDDYDLGNTSCSQCMASKCGSQLSAVCNDPMGSLTQQELSFCGKNPSIDDGNCRKIYTDAGPVTIDDTAGRRNNMRACLTQQCAKPGICEVCLDLEYKRYDNDMYQPLTPQTSACAACLLSNCNDVLLGLDRRPDGGTLSHCCYKSPVEQVWGKCVRTTANGGTGPDCTEINKLANEDGGSQAYDCDYRLARCAASSCASECPGIN